MTTAWIEVALVPQSEIAVSQTRPAGVEISTTTTEVQIQTYPAPQIEVAIGAPGAKGDPGESITYISDAQPANGQEKETWYNPLTLQLKVFHNGAWRPVSPDGGHF